VAYDKIRTDGTSCHAFADSNGVLVEVRDEDRSHSARMHGNEIGLQLELCGTAQTREQWLDSTSKATLRFAAMWVAEKCKAYGLAVRRLSIAEVRAAYFGPTKSKGICGHGDVTIAYPEDRGDHTDPGPNFPWDIFLSWVSEELAKLNNPNGETDMPKLFIVTDEVPKDKVCISDGSTRRWLEPKEELGKVMAAWGLSFPSDATRITSVEANKVYGPDIDTLRGKDGIDGEDGKDGLDGEDGLGVGSVVTITGTGTISDEVID
jgi:hypothetical protein